MGRWLQRAFVRCGKCSNTQRHIEGYTPLPDPQLFAAKAHLRNHVKEIDASVGFRGGVTTKCESCAKFHGEWTTVDFQTLLSERGAK